MTAATIPADRMVRGRALCAARVRSTGDDGPGTFSAVVSTFDESYPIGGGWSEKIRYGAWTKSLASRAAFPLFWQHDSRDAPVGSATGEENFAGLVIHGKLFLDAGGDVVRIYRALVDGAVSEFSVGFIPTLIESSPGAPMLDVIVEADLLEVSVCLRGMNPSTGVIDVRSRKAPAGDHAALWSMMGTHAGRRRVAAYRAAVADEKRARR